MKPLQRAIDHYGSQRKLAAALGVTQPTVNDWLRGRRPIPTDRCMQIERLTGVRCEDLKSGPDWGVLRGALRRKRK